MSRRELTGALDSLIRLLDTSDDLTAVKGGATLERARAVLARAQAGFTTPVPWTPLERASHQAARPAQVAMIQRILPNVDAATARSLLEVELAGTQLWVNSRYQVAERTVDDYVHLSVKRLDQGAVHDWRDLQRIKDELVGPQCEGVELYPANSRLVDSANQYHLWCRPDPTFRFPFGFNENLVLNEAGGGANQRARDVTDQRQTEET